MEPILVQDFITVKGAGDSHVIQTGSNWIDLGDVEDLVFYTDVRETSAMTTLTIETSPSALESQFVKLVTMSLAVGVRTDMVLASTAKVPPARYLRWHLTSPGGWDVTFRILAGAYRWA